MTIRLKTPLLTVAAAAVLASEAAFAVTVPVSVPGVTGSYTAQARWRDLDADNNASAAEIFLEAPVITPPAPVQSEVNNLVNPTSATPFTLAWDGTALTASLNGVSSGPLALTSPTFTDVLFFIRTQPNAQTPVTLALNDLAIGSTAYGSVSLTSGTSGSATGFWLLTDVLNSNPFTLTGNLALGAIPAQAGGQDAWRFEVSLGELQPVPEPGTMGLLALGAASLLMMGRRRRG
jgi:hypothetical protein